MSDASDLSPLIGPVARRLFGDPSPLSSEDVLRFGPTGALHVDLATHRWWDAEDEAAGGGILDLVEYRTGQANGEAVTWLEGHGFSLAKSTIIINQEGGDPHTELGRSASAADKSPPRELVNLELEQQLLGALLMHPGQTAAVAYSLRCEHFSEPLHRRLYDIITELAAGGKLASPVTIQPYLPATPGFDVKGYVAKLAAEYAGAPAEAYAGGIIELAIARTLVTVGEDIAAAARAPDPAEPAKLQIESAITRLSVLASAGLRPMLRASSVGSAAQALVAEMDAPTPAERPVSTGLAALDRIIGGHRRGTLNILAGRPGMGKSLLAGSSALQLARRGEAAVYFSMEMTKPQLTARLLTDQAFRFTQPALYNGVLDHTLTDEHRGLIRQAAREIEGYPLVIDPQPGMSIAEIGVRAARYVESFAKRGLRVPLIIVDHLGKVRRPYKQNDNVELGQVTARGAEIAKELETCVMLLCQLNRGVEGREDNRPRLSDLRESGHIEEDADTVMMLYREAYYEAKKPHGGDPAKHAEKIGRLAHDMDMHVTKNRHGPEGVARLWVHMGAGLVRDREDRY